MMAALLVTYLRRPPHHASGGGTGSRRRRNRAPELRLSRRRAQRRRDRPPGATPSTACANRSSSAREELTRQERISTIGRLSTSIVHDLRNPLAAIYAGAEMLFDGNLPVPQVHRLATNIYRAARGIQDMLQQLLNVSRGRNGVAEVCAVREVISAAWSAESRADAQAQSQADQRRSRGAGMSHGARPHGARVLQSF